MRRRLSTLVSNDRSSSEPLGIARKRVRASRNVGDLFKEFLKRGARKEKPGGGNAGSDLFVIGVYGFKYAAWLLLVTPESAERLFLLSSQISVLVLLLSCSSLTFRNLTE